MNCKNCKWLCHYDGYFCGNGNAKTDETAFIENIKKDVCAEFEQRVGKFWISKDGKF